MEEAAIGPFGAYVCARVVGVHVEGQRRSLAFRLGRNDLVARARCRRSQVRVAARHNAQDDECELHLGG